MSTTVLDALRNAKINFETICRRGMLIDPVFVIALEQLSNAVSALEKGRASDYVIQENIASEIKT